MLNQKSSVKFCLNCGDIQSGIKIIYFIKRIQFNTGLAVSCAITSPPKGKFYQYLAWNLLDVTMMKKTLFFSNYPIIFFAVFLCCINHREEQCCNNAPEFLVSKVVTGMFSANKVFTKFTENTCALALFN